MDAKQLLEELETLVDIRMDAEEDVFYNCTECAIIEDKLLVRINGKNFRIKVEEV